MSDEWCSAFWAMLWNAPSFTAYFVSVGLGAKTDTQRRELLQTRSYSVSSTQPSSKAADKSCQTAKTCVLVLYLVH